MAWTATSACGLQGARDARVAGFAQRSHRHRLPPRTDDYVRGGKRTEGSQNPGHAHARTLGSAKLSQSTALLAVRAEHASTGQASAASNASHEAHRQSIYRFGA